MLTCKQVDDLIPAYVLDAVDRADRAELEAHLAGCPDCRRLVQDYDPVVSLLPYAAPQRDPSPDVKYRVLAAILPKAKPEPARSAPARAVLIFSSVFQSPAWSALALLLMIALGAWNVILQTQMAQQAASSRQLAVELSRQRDFLTALAYGDGRPHVLQGSALAADAVGRLYRGPTDSSFMVITYDMPVLPPDRVYQLWLIDAVGNRANGGTFTVDEQGRGYLFAQAPESLGQYRAVGVTMEPLGGSPGPTGTKMLGGDLDKTAGE
jgi:anti-sigma factor RsiW